MAEYMFGVRNSDGRTPGRERDRREDIAKRHGCWWTEMYDIGSGKWKSWFSTRNMGHPFDGQKESAVMKEVRDG